ncbi:DUF2339 domain-containing protein [Thaumasiovibrio subtropicus]|uniref:DUF2339 domain-containing protein n=1 Tax=Thaumasiovibrio subtropicus TaxID=1891207 RepID=UPI000B3591B9|nr:DUF2339 domain-containing protein [Thaumasiovibrio subtropicus]
MEGLLGILGVLIAVGGVSIPIIAILAFLEVRRLKDEVKHLKSEMMLSQRALLQLKARIDGDVIDDYELAPSVSSSEVALSTDVPHSENAPVTPTSPPQKASSRHSHADPKISESQQDAWDGSDEATPFQILLSHVTAHLKRNWLIWSGGVALVFGMGYLMQFVGSRVTVSPEVRIASALSLSVLVVMLSEWLHRQVQAGRWALDRVVGKQYIPATFSSAGMTGIYTSVVFGTVSYDLFSPTLALALIALTALFSLGMSLRYGSLMAVLGLIGGYTAPIWVGEGQPNYWVLMGYISAITAVAIYVQHRLREDWLPPLVVLAHLFWLAMCSVDRSANAFAVWSMVYYPLSLYLLAIVPQQGWRIAAVYRQRELGWYNPGFVSVLILALFVTLNWIDPADVRFLPALMVTPLICLLLPKIRKGYCDHRAQWHALSAAIGGALLQGQYLIDGYGDAAVLSLPVTIGIALWLIVMTFSHYLQYRASYRSVVSYWWLVTSTPLTMIAWLLYVDSNVSSGLMVMTVVTFVVSLGFVFLAWRDQRLRGDMTMMLHLTVLVLNWLWFDNALFTSLLVLQLLVMSMQLWLSSLLIRALTVKVALTLLIARLTLLPFVADWHVSWLPDSATAIANGVPAFLVLSYLMVRLRRHQHQLADWFEAAAVHVLALIVLMQIHYWWTGSTLIYKAVDFTSVSFWLIQSLTLIAVYGHRAKSATSMIIFYRCYRYGLMLVSAYSMMALHTTYLPLTEETVSAAAWPLFNGLSMGWLLPGILMVIIGRKRLQPPPFEAAWITWSGIALIAAWVGLSIRQFWQVDTLHYLADTSMAEWLTYSGALILSGATWTYWAVSQHQVRHQTLGLAVMGAAILKVFLLDASYLDGIWRAVSFLGLGLALIGLGWLFQTLKRRQQTVNDVQ